MDIQEEILRLCNNAIHPETICEKLNHLEGRDTIQARLCRMVEDGLLDADVNVVETMDGDLVSHVHMIYGRMDKRVAGFTL